MQDKPFRLEDAETEANEWLKKMEQNKESLDNTASLIINRVDNDNKKISNHKEKLKTIKNHFKGNFIVIFILGISLIIRMGMNKFSTDNISNISMPSSLMHNFLMYERLFWHSLIVLIVSLALFFYTYSKEISTYSIERNGENYDIENGETYSLNLTSTSQSNENITADIEKSKEILLSIVGTVGDSIPVINGLYKSTTRLVKYRNLVENYQQSLAYYNLINDDSFFDKIGEFVPARNIIIEDVEGDWENTVTAKIHSYCIKKEIAASYNILLLLYNEYNGKDCTSTFKKVKDSKKEIEELADILIKSQRLIDTPNNYKYKNEDLNSIIKKINSFSLSDINSRLTDSFFILSYLDSYIEFLKKSEVDTQSYTSSIKLLIDNSGDNKVPVADIVVPLAYNLGFNIFNKIPSLNNDKSLIEGFVRASIALKFHDDIPLRKKACQYSANNHAVAILRTYQQKMKDNGGQQVVLLGQLTKDIEEIKSFLEKSNDSEGIFFLKQLKHGEWYDTSFALLMDFIEKARDSINTNISNIQKYEVLKKSVRDAFENVDLTIIEKSIDAQIFGAYIIFFSGVTPPKKGKNKLNENSDDSNSRDEEGLKAIIDKLSIRDLESSDKWDFRSEQKKEEIKKEYEYQISPKYDFMTFSPNTRIGILDKGKSFSEFQREFLNDVKIMLKLKKHETFKIGIIVQKIMPSDNSLGIIDDNGLPDNIQIKDLDVVKTLAKLASTSISVDYQISAMKFEKSVNLIKIINERTFYEMIKDEYDELTKEAEYKILNSSELRQSLLDELNKMGLKDFMSVGLHLRRGNLSGETRDKVEEIIRSVLEKEYNTKRDLKGMSKVRSEILSSRFIDSVENLAILCD